MCGQVPWGPTFSKWGSDGNPIFSELGKVPMGRGPGSPKKDSLGHSALQVDAVQTLANGKKVNGKGGVLPAPLHGRSVAKKLTEKS